MNDLRDTFFQECDDLLEGLSAGLSELESDSGDAETVNAMFRSVHSIKGGAGAFGLDQLVAFAHALENVLDDIRSARTAIADNVISLLFTASDHLTDLVEAARNEQDLPEGSGASILSDLKLLTQSVNGNTEEQEDAPDFEPLALDFSADLPPLADEGTVAEVASFHITLRASEALYATGNDPALLLRALADLGETTIRADLSGLSSQDAGNWQNPQLAWEVDLSPRLGVDEAAVREVFEFVEGTCDLAIEVLLDDPGRTSLTPSLPDLESVVSETLNPPVPDTPGRSAGTPEQRADPAKSQAARASTIRVELLRVDRLINLVGELVISEAMLRQSVSEDEQGTNSAAKEAMNQLRQLSGMIQESVMAIRAQPVRNLFQRMSRIVRESAREAGKQARLVTVGEATEVDKTVTERLVEPLTHMIRNAVDHGIERAEDRIAAGKPERGTVTLAAAHRSGRVVITLSDDGAGINRPVVRRLAEEKSLIRPDEDLTDAEIDNLLFRPGFSTAKEVSNLSGRGVGMDVVRSEIQTLGGRVSLQSTPGEGTTLTISLPLTLAVLEGMVVIVEGEALVVPTLALRETLQPRQARLHRLGPSDFVLPTPDGLVPVIDLGAMLGYRSVPRDYDASALLLIESENGKRTALAVDDIVDQREVVIKGLEQNYRAIPGIAAATILGDGNIALIVDTEQIVAGSATRPLHDPNTNDMLGVA